MMGLNAVGQYISRPPAGDAPNTTRRACLLLGSLVAAPWPSANAAGEPSEEQIRAAVKQAFDKTAGKNKVRCCINLPSISPTGTGRWAKSVQVLRATTVYTQAPVLLRMVFHDAGTFSQKAGDGGANASLRFELKRPENKGLNRGWKVIDQTMAALAGTAAEGRVSYADLIALGGAYAVAVTGGPDIRIPIGQSF